MSLGRDLATEGFLLFPIETYEAKYPPNERGEPDVLLGKFWDRGRQNPM